MSYDLQVYGPEAAVDLRVPQLVSEVPSLALGEHDEAAGWWTVVRGARRGYCFTVEGPQRVEPEDVPDEVTAVLLGAAHVLSVSAEGTAGPDIPHAVRFARRVAGAVGGVVVDQQTEQVWAKSGARQSSKPAPNGRVRVIDLSWYVQRERVSNDLVARYLALCRRTLPEALPRRFGEYEPLQGKMAETGDEGLIRAWQEATGNFFFTSSTPCLGGSMTPGPGDRFPGDFWHLNLDVHARPFAEDQRWRDALRRLFIGTAQEFGAFYASAEVTRGNIWNGRSIWSDGDTEWPTTPARREGWLGLPPYPTWWAWYGDLYRPLVKDRLGVGAVTDLQPGVLHELATEPADRDELVRALAKGQAAGGDAGWVPPSLLAKTQPYDGWVQPVPLDPADVIPATLQKHGGTEPPRRPG